MKKIDVAMVLNTAAVFMYLFEPFRNPFINVSGCFIFLVNMAYLTCLLDGKKSELEAELRELEAELRELEAERREFEAELREFEAEQEVIE